MGNVWRRIYPQLPFSTLNDDFKFLSPPDWLHHVEDDHWVLIFQGEHPSHERRKGHSHIRLWHAPSNAFVVWNPLSSWRQMVQAIVPIQGGRVQAHTGMA